MARLAFLGLLGRGCFAASRATVASIGEKWYYFGATSALRQLGLPALVPLGVRLAPHNTTLLTALHFIPAQLQVAFTFTTSLPQHTLDHLQFYAFARHIKLSLRNAHPYDKRKGNRVLHGTQLTQQ